MPEEPGRSLITSRWESGSHKSLGRPVDDEAIRTLVLNSLSGAKRSGIDKVRWLSPDEVMVTAIWWNSPVTAAGYYAVLQRGPNGVWEIVVSYLAWQA
jgi:hypothetical protein